MRSPALNATKTRSAAASAKSPNGGVTIANRSLINQRATCPGVVTDNDPTNTVPDGTIIYNHPNDQGEERLSSADDIRTRRAATNVLGLGFVEAISNTTLQNI